MGQRAFGVNFNALLNQVALDLNLSLDQQKFLFEQIKSFPFHEYLLDPQHALMRDLGVDNVYIVTKDSKPEHSDGEELIPWQQMKVDGCQFPLLKDGNHIHIVTSKRSADLIPFLKQRQGEGYTSFVFINDKPDELREAKMAIDQCTLDGYYVHFDYGRYRYTDLPDAREFLEDRYYKVPYDSDDTMTHEVMVRDVVRDTLRNMLQSIRNEISLKEGHPQRIEKE